MKDNQEKSVREQKKIKKNYLYTALLFLALFGIYQYGIHQIYGMVEYPDEFGYWSTAASMVGWDWSQMASRGSYYSFGYSLILFPILKFCEDSVTAYRMAVTVNFSLIAVSFFLLKGIYKRIFTEQVEGEEILAIGSALLYPAWSFYAQTTLVDSLLIFMVILICYLFLRFIEVPKIGWGIALVAAVMYNYSLHMRSAGIVVAVVIVMILWAWKEPSYLRDSTSQVEMFTSQFGDARERVKLAERVSHRWKKVLPLLLGVVCLFLVIGWIKGLVQGEVFAEAGQEVLNNNDYGGQWNKIVFLFSLDGLKQLFTVVMGKVLYLGIASAGLVYVAVVWCGEQVADLWKKSGAEGKQCGVKGYKSGVRNRNSGINVSDSEQSIDGIADNKAVESASSEWFGLLFLLMMLGQLAVCVIYTIHSNNVDWLIYGRYIEAFVPMAIFVGVSYALQKIGTSSCNNLKVGKETLLSLLGNRKIEISFVFVYTLAAISCISKVWGQTTDHIRGEHSVAAIFLSGDGTVEPVTFFVLVWLAGLLLMALIRIGLQWFKEERFSLGVVAGMFALFAVWSIHASETYTYKGNDHMARERIITNVLEEQLAQGKDIYYLEEGNGNWICFTQMQLRDKTLPVIKVEDLDNLDSKNSAVVVDGESEWLEYMESTYNRKIAGNYHYVFYEN